MESSIFLLNKEEKSCLRGVGGVNLFYVKVFIEEVFSSLPFFRGEGVEFSNLWREGFGKIDLMVIWLERRDMVSGFFWKDRGELEVFWRKDDYRFCSFSSNYKFSGGSKASDDWEFQWSEARSIMNDLLDGPMFLSLVNENRLFFPLVVFIKVKVCDGVNVNVMRRSGRGSVGAVVSFDINFMECEEVFRFIDGFINGESLFDPVDNWICDS